MFVLELTFDADPRRLAPRTAHRARLAALHATGRLVLAGPWRDDSGALLIFRTDRATLDAILAADPYYTTPASPSPPCASGRRSPMKSIAADRVAEYGHVARGRRV
ncbi:YciI family protein [Amycolatopsis sp. NPDC051903]|uniref:YciI family protein n=1 Tax=Amycolatopsis sp. NPDC051903 TaxID=3363936 RepID=UPI003792E783